MINLLQDFIKNIADKIKDALLIDEEINPQDFQQNLIKISKKKDECDYIIDISGDFKLPFAFFHDDTNLNIKASQIRTDNADSLAMMFRNKKNFSNLNNYHKDDVTGYFYADIPSYNTSNVTGGATAFAEIGENHKSYINIPLLDFGSFQSSLSSLFNNCPSYIASIGGFKDYGKSVATKKQATIDLRHVYSVEENDTLPRTSIINIFNNLYDINGKTFNDKNIYLGRHYSKVTAEDIAIATNKGWIVKENA